MKRTREQRPRACEDCEPQGSIPNEWRQRIHERARGSSKVRQGQVGRDTEPSSLPGGGAPLYTLYGRSLGAQAGRSSVGKHVGKQGGQSGPGVSQVSRSPKGVRPRAHAPAPGTSPPVLAPRPASLGTKPSSATSNPKQLQSGHLEQSSPPPPHGACLRLLLRRLRRLRLPLHPRLLLLPCLLLLFR